MVMPQDSAEAPLDSVEISLEDNDVEPWPLHQSVATAADDHVPPEIKKRARESDGPSSSEEVLAAAEGLRIPATALEGTASGDSCGGACPRGSANDCR